MAGIYVHIPFCHSKCAYCDFYSRVGAAVAADSYISALTLEFNNRIYELDAHHVSTIYIGGGTPSILSAEQFLRLIAVFKDFSPEEFTIEVNPEDIESSRLETWLKSGVNRVSMGVQSLVDSELKAVGRRHSAQQAINSLKRIREAGFNNISCDLIYGLPGQTMESWQYSVDTLIALKPEHLSAYSLTIEPHTALGVKMQRGDFSETDDDTIASFYDYLCNAASRAGYEHYEISNFALPGLYSRHNSAYWNSTPYLGLGPGAHSLGADGIRRYVEPDIRRYISNPALCLKTDHETETEKINDIIFTSLRTAKGLDLSLIPPEFLSEFKKKATQFEDNGIICRNGMRIYIPEERWLTSDAIIRDLLID
ncbi:MAG: radical SAM family heme chaperone HemW [Muribaculaceae bacterium]|nr:radical SAM family heme chaperone HemW [Muribaculaceae bacterium]